jgi:tetratricopeptide (TPR) repeat protein
MKRLVTYISVFVSLLGWAQTDTANLFEQGNKAYNAEDFEGAISTYEKILETGQHSAELYFNLGNANYKLNRPGPSIYYFEKALLLSPDDKEILENLAYAQNMTLDAFVPMPENDLSNFYKNTVGLLSFEQWAYVSIAMMLLFILGYLIYHFSALANRKRIAFLGGTTALIISVMAVGLAYVRYSEFMADDPAIVFAAEVVVTDAPNANGAERFRLHEGTKVIIEEGFEGWKKVRIPDGNTGWMPAEDLKALKDF